MSKQKRARGRQKKSWMEGIRKAMNERNLNEGQWEDKKEWSLGVGQHRKIFEYIYNVKIQWWFKQNARHFKRRQNKHRTRFCACQVVTVHNINTEIMSSLYIYACEQLRAVNCKQPAVYGNVECRSSRFCFVYSKHTGRTHTERYKAEYTCDSMIWYIC
jgi:hypothetical protein